MIKLYGYGPAWELPDCSPSVAKVDCYLRMVALPYTLVPWRSCQGKRGQANNTCRCYQLQTMSIPRTATKRRDNGSHPTLNR
jgi:hypothetical protein